MSSNIFDFRGHRRQLSQRPPFHESVVDGVPMAVLQNGSVVGGTAGGLRDDGDGQFPGVGIGSGLSSLLYVTVEKAFAWRCVSGVDPGSGKSEGQSWGVVV